MFSVTHENRPRPALTEPIAVVLLLDQFKKSVQKKKER